MFSFPILKSPLRFSDSSDVRSCFVRALKCSVSDRKNEAETQHRKIEHFKTLSKQEHASAIIINN